MRNRTNRLRSGLGALLFCVATQAAVCLRVADISPPAGRIGTQGGATPLFGIGIECTAGERWQAVEFTMVGDSLRPEHFRTPNPGNADKHGRLRDHSGFGIFRSVYDDGAFSTDNALPSQNDKPVTLSSAEAIDLSRWPRVRIGLPSGVVDSPTRQRFVVAIRLAAKPPADGTSIRARLDRVVFDRHTPWLTPLPTRPLVVDTTPPRLTLSGLPAGPLAPGKEFRLVVQSNEPLACPPQVLFRPKGTALANDGRGQPMVAEGASWQFPLRPLLRLTPNGHPDGSPVSYTTWPESIRPQYADDGKKLLDGECRPSWFVGKALQWRHAPRVDILVDLGQSQSVETARIWIPYRHETPLVTCETAEATAGPWQPGATGRPPDLGRGPAFSQPVNSVWLTLPKRPARFVRFRLTEFASPQVSEVEVFGEPEGLPPGTWELVVRAWDGAWNHTAKTQLIEVKP